MAIPAARALGNRRKPRDALLDAAIDVAAAEGFGGGGKDGDFGGAGGQGVLQAAQVGDQDRIGNGGFAALRAAGRARAHDHRDLRDAGRRHACQIVKNPPEMLAVGEHFVLQWQIRAALYGGVIGDDHTFPPLDAADAGGQPGGRDFVSIDFVRGGRRRGRSCAPSFAGTRGRPG